jgi:hypothetical protein
MRGRGPGCLWFDKSRSQLAKKVGGVTLGFDPVSPGPRHPLAAITVWALLSRAVVRATVSLAMRRASRGFSPPQPAHHFKDIVMLQ